LNLRAVRTAAALLIACVALAIPVVARAAPIDDKRAEANRLQAQMDANGYKIAALGERYNGASLRLGQADAAMTDAQRRYDQAQSQWEQVRHQLGQRAATVYTGAASQNPMQDLDVRSLNDIMSRSNYAAALASRDKMLLSSLAAARDDLTSRRKTLGETRARAKSDLDRITATRRELEGANATQQQLLGRVKGELASLMTREQERRAAEARSQAAANAARLANQGSTGRAKQPARGRAPGVGPDTPLPNAPSPSAGAAAAIAYARAQLGKPYIYATSGPDTFDCSGLTLMAWRAGGVSMPHYSGAQFSMFPHVSLSALQPGDLVFMGPGGADHVALYVGGGMQIAATHTGSFVLLQPVQFDALSGAVRPG
jgi:cell wall-associated NlpC family hydrolase